MSKFAIRINQIDGDFQAALSIDGAPFVDMLAFTLKLWTPDGGTLDMYSSRKRRRERLAALRKKG